MKPNAQLNAVFQLIKGATTLKVFQRFLNDKNLQHSATTWKELFDKRVVPAFEVGTLTLADLQGLLQEVEEYGRQHIFLFACEPSRAAQMLSKSRIKAITKEQDHDGLLTSPLAVELPAKPAVVDLRWGASAFGGKVHTSFLVKVVETRIHYELAGEHKNANGTITKELAPVKTRGVNTARLSEDGLLEVRLASHRNSTQYKDSLNLMLTEMSPWFPKDDFTPTSLTKAKNAIHSDRADLKKKLRHGTQTFTNDNGTSLTARTSAPSDDVLGDKAAENSMDSFFQSDGRCESSSVFFRLGSTGEPRELQVNLMGEVNEFSIPLSSTEEDYEYVLSEIRTLNS